MPVSHYLVTRSDNMEVCRDNNQCAEAGFIFAVTTSSYFSRLPLFARFSPLFSISPPPPPFPPSLSLSPSFSSLSRRPLVPVIVFSAFLTSLYPFFQRLRRYTSRLLPPHCGASRSIISRSKYSGIIYR